MRIKTRDLILVALFAALTAVGAFIRIPIGPAPITLQLFFTVLAGVLLGPYLGALSQLIYVALGLAGLPVFTGGGGFAYILTPNFGYLIGFILCPLVIGRIIRAAKKPSYLRSFLACMLGILAVYIVGVPYMYLILRYVTHTEITFANACVVGFLVFLPGDTAKSLIAAYLGKRLAPALKRNQ